VKIGGRIFYRGKANKIGLLRPYDSGGDGMGPPTPKPLNVTSNLSIVLGRKGIDNIGKILYNQPEG
jgi:hypothetical protein